jgi:proteasome lid subunit RPN8/RPN11
MQALQTLQAKYSDTGPERCGFVLNDGTVVEVENICNEPNDGFMFRAEDIIKHENTAASTWHTHPGDEANLSSDDYLAFLNWPKLSHIVIGASGPREFVVINGAIIEA